jgi:hypothetical protein
MVSPSEILAVPVIIVAGAATVGPANSIEAIRGIRAGRRIMGVLSAVTAWIERRRQLRCLFQHDARQLIERDPLQPTMMPNERPLVLALLVTACLPFIGRR